jgi:hypothetical protein
VGILLQQLWNYKSYLLRNDEFLIDSQCYKHAQKLQFSALYRRYSKVVPVSSAVQPTAPNGTLGTAGFPRRQAWLIPAFSLIFPDIFTLGKIASIAFYPHGYWLFATGCTGFCYPACGWFVSY